MSIDYEILLKISAGSPRHLAVDKTPQQLDDALCCQSCGHSFSEAEFHENGKLSVSFRSAATWVLPVPRMLPFRQP